MGLLKIKEAAAIAGVSRQWIHQLILDGRLPFERDPLSRWYLVDPADVRKLPQLKKKMGRPRKTENGQNNT